MASNPAANSILRFSACGQRAAVRAADDLPFEFAICARADGVMIGVHDCDEAILRLQAYEAIGAYCVYAPMPPSFSELQRKCQSVSGPINVLCTGQLANHSKQEYV